MWRLPGNKTQAQFAISYIKKVHSTICTFYICFIKMCLSGISSSTWCADNFIHCFYSKSDAATIHVNFGSHMACSRHSWRHSVFKAVVFDSHRAHRHRIDSKLAIFDNKLTFVSAFGLFSALVALPKSVRCRRHQNIRSIVEVDSYFVNWEVDAWRRAL